MNVQVYFLIVYFKFIIIIIMVGADDFEHIPNDFISR